MKKKKVIVPVLLCVAALMAACGGEKEVETSSIFEEMEIENQAEGQTEEQQDQSEEQKVQSEGQQDQSEEQQDQSEELPDQPDQQVAEVSSAPVENETADGFMGSFLLASDRDKIDTTNEYGVLYRVIYEASIEENELIACGSMDYRNFKDQDPITISSDVKHIFKVDDNTEYLKDGEEGTETLSKDDFAGLLDSRKDSGMYFEVEISSGVVKTVRLAAQ